MEYDPFCEGYMTETYPKLKSRPFFVKYKGLDLDYLDKMLRFVIVLIDPLSPVGHERDFDIRVRFASEKTGVVFDPENEVFQKYAFEYFKMINAIGYEAWFTLKMAFHQISRSLRSFAMKDSDRLRAMREMDSIKANLLKEEHFLFPDSHTKRLVNDMAVEESLLGYAEKYAQDLDT